MTFPGFDPYAAVDWGMKPMAVRAQVLGNRTVDGKKALGVSWRLEPLHPPLSLVDGLKGSYDD